MRSHRRLVVTERVIPFLAAAVGLLALAGAVIVQVDARQRAEQVSQELARIRLSLDLLRRPAPPTTAPPKASWRCRTG